MTTDPEKVEVKRIEKVQSAKPHNPTLFEHLYIALGPVLGGLIIDTVDFVTFGPIGLYIGLLAGAIIGWLVSSIYGFSTKSKLIWSLLAGIYCTIPGTALFPLATVISVISRFCEKPKSKNR